MRSPFPPTSVLAFMIGMCFVESRVFARNWAWGYGIVSPLSYSRPQFPFPRLFAFVVLVNVLGSVAVTLYLGFGIVSKGRKL